MTNVTFRQIQSFLEVAEHASFTRAAERLRVAQPALSQQIRDLETELRVRLFDRTTRRVELTEAGREFRAAAAKIFAELDQAARNAHDLADRKRGRIAIAAPPLLAALIVPPAVADFRDQYPGIQVGLVDAMTDQIVQQVRSGAVDCGLGTFRGGEDGISAAPLARDRLMLFSRRSGRFTRRSAVEWRSLDGLALITLTRASGIRLLVEVGFETAQTPFAPAYEVSHITTVLAMVEAGLGVAVLPTYAFAATRARDLIALPLVSPSIARDIVMITRAGRAVSPAVSVFARFLSKHTLALLPPDPLHNS